jgi:hypothetical protein
MLNNNPMDKANTRLRKDDMAKSSKANKCYIAASANDDLLLRIKHYLEVREIDVTDAYSLELSETSLIVQTESKIKRSTFFVAIISLVEPNPNVFYELGIARAMCKPAFLIIRDKGNLPTSIAEMNYVRASTTNLETIFYSLDKFLNVVVGKSKQKKVCTSDYDIPLEIKGIEIEETEQQFVLPKNEKQLVEDIKTLFDKQGIVYFIEKLDNKRVDMSLWVDSLEKSIGNPILVELKAGRLTEAIICEAEQKLIESIKTVHGRGGLLIYSDSNGRHFKRSKWQSPLIIRIDFKELLSANVPVDLVILSERNQIVHQSGE